VLVEEVCGVCDDDFYVVCFMVFIILGMLCSIVVMVLVFICLVLCEV